MDEARIKLQTIKKTANDGTIDILVEVLLEIIDKLDPKPPVGFTSKDEK